MSQFRIFPNHREQFTRVLRIDGTRLSNVLRSCTIKRCIDFATTFGLMDPGRKLKFRQPLILTVVGKAFFDVGHAPGQITQIGELNLEGYAAWEIHPVMKLEVKSD
jgi:hypothetical protein